jgi:hypothetical protein
MRQDQIALELCCVTGLDPDTGKLAEPGVDAVDRLIAFGRLANQGRRRLDARQGAVVKHNGFSGAPDLFELVKRGLTGVERQRHNAPPKIRFQSGLNPMR